MISDWLQGATQPWDSKYKMYPWDSKAMIGYRTKTYAWDSKGSIGNRGIVNRGIVNQSFIVCSAKTNASRYSLWIIEL